MWPDWVPTFEYPELLLLAVPLWLLYQQQARASGVTGKLRIALLALLLLGLAGPVWKIGGDGLDVVLVIDRSRSMPGSSEERALEIISNVEQERGAGDRLAIVTFGAGAQIEHTLSQTIETSTFAKTVLPDGSDLNDGLLTALSLLDPARPARLLVLSDGEANGANPESAARRARELEVPVDYRVFERLSVGDAAITDLQLPDSLAPREQFQFTVLIDSGIDTAARLILFRDGIELAVQELRLVSGTNSIRFRDQLNEPGFHKYTAELETADDPISQNNIGEGGVRVLGAPRILVLNTDGVEGNLVRALRAGELNVDVAVADQHPLTQDDLDPYRAVILENVAAGKLGRVRMDRLAQFVEDLGGGLMLTGGQRSFGAGGYYRSPLDDLLPVSMELREEHRKARVAIAIALDRSGSMRVPVSDTQTKMDLANQGSVECIRLLSAGDSVALIAVDTAAEVVQALTDVEQRSALINAAQSIRSEGGGIWVDTALEAARAQLLDAPQSTRHVILFSDANDSKLSGVGGNRSSAAFENKLGQLFGLIEAMVQEGITISVIGLGTEADQDAQLLIEIAERGQGNVLFSDDPAELPRLFSEDAMSVARSSFVEYDPETQPDGIPGTLLEDARLMGEFEPGRFPGVHGYNLTYLRSRATQAVVSADEFVAPWSAFWYRELGRVSALTLDVDGQFQGPFGDWDDYADFLVTHARWLIGTDSSDPAYVSIRREGLDAVVNVELDPARTSSDFETPVLWIIPPGRERVAAEHPDFVWVDADRLQARFRMQKNGTYRTRIQFGERESQAGPVVSLPYSPEFFPRRGLPNGLEVLQRVAEISGGGRRTNVATVFENPPRSAQRRALLPWILAIVMLIMLLEIAGRRLDLWNRKPESLEELQPEAEIAAAELGWVAGWRLRWRRRHDLKVARRQSQVQDAPEALPPAAQSDGAEGVFETAKRRAKRRLSE